MYTAISSIFSFITAFMFLRMHHVHGSDTSMERTVIVIGTVLFLIQSGLSYQIFSAIRSRVKMNLTIGSIICTILYGALFFLIVDFKRDSIFSTLF